MLSVLVTGSVAFLITFIATPAIMRVASEKGLFDVPDQRKLHKKRIASLGGVGMFIGFFMAMLLTLSSRDNSNFQYFYAAAVAIFFLGLKDDILVLSAKKKFIGQLVATAIIVHLGGIQLNSLHGFLGIYNIPEIPSVIFSYATILVVINAYNLIDGVDGLAGTLGLMTTFLFGLYFYQAGFTSYAMLSAAFAGALLAFLKFNYNPARIFMGDSGSLMLGLINAILVIKFINVAEGAPVYSLASAGAIGFSFLVVPLLDTLRVFSIRIRKGKSPFSPDRNHIHHLLLDRGMNHNQVTLTIVGLNLSIITAVFLGRSLGPTPLIIGSVAMFYCVIGVLYFVIKPVNQLVIAKSFKVPEPKIIPSATTKIVSLAPESAAVES